MNTKFQDRVPTYPNRYKVTKGDGTSEHITLERADEPIVVGTALNANTFNTLISEIEEELRSSSGAVGSVARNLLDNSDFTNPVNQRGQASYSVNNGMTIDRWSAGSSGTFSLNIGYSGLTVTFDDKSLDWLLFVNQRFPKGVLSSYKKYTLAAYYAGEGVRIGTLETERYGNDPYFYTDSNDFDQVTFSIKENETVVWAALYEGEYTAETIPEYQPKGYGAELVECQRYYRNFYRVTYRPYNVSSTVRYYRVPIVPSMRMGVAPTITLDGCLETPINSWTEIESECLAYNSSATDFTISATGTNSSSDFVIRIDKIEVSADL